jgi:hypothetical protein
MAAQSGREATSANPPPAPTNAFSKGVSLVDMVVGHLLSLSSKSEKEAKGRGCKKCPLTSISKLHPSDSRPGREKFHSKNLSSPKRNDLQSTAVVGGETDNYQWRRGKRGLGGRGCRHVKKNRASRRPCPRPAPNLRRQNPLRPKEKKNDRRRQKVRRDDAFMSKLKCN